MFRLMCFICVQQKIKVSCISVSVQIKWNKLKVKQNIIYFTKLMNVVVA